MERGRPRIFEEQTALDAALKVFWRNGYQAASLAELTQAMGISKPSMYGTFGNKEQLYLLALQRYREQQLNQHAQALNTEPQLKPALREFLRSVAKMVASPDLPAGCMVVTSAVACDLQSLPDSVMSAIANTVNQSTFKLIGDRLREEQAQQRLAADIDIDQLADYFATLMSGMAVMAKVGVSQQRLFDVIEQALRVLPE